MGHKGEARLQVSSQGFLQQHRIHCTKPPGFGHQHNIQLLQNGLGAQQAPRGLRTVFQVGIGATGTSKAANLVVAWATVWLKSWLSLSQNSPEPAGSWKEAARMLVEFHQSMVLQDPDVSV